MAIPTGPFSNDIQEIILALREYVHSQWTLSTIHGISHWDRVYANGLQLLTPDVDPLVVAMFAYLHDSCRMNDGYDTVHGIRAAEWIDTLRASYLKILSDKQMEQLKTACRLHTTTPKTGDPTVDACFDADRLDLWRVDIIPDPKRMATEKGKQIARETDYELLCPSR